MRAFLITFRPHPMEQDLLPLFLNYFEPYVNKYNHRWIIEKDNTPDAHLHAYIETEFRDTEKLRKSSAFKTMISQVKLLLFCKSTSAYQTKYEIALDVKLVKQDEEDQALGYLFKELGITNCHTHNISEQRQLKCCKIYWTDEKLKEMTYTKKNWTAVTVKNAHALIEDFCDKQEISLNKTDWISVKLKMVKQRYTFSQISEKAQKTIIAELTYHHESKLNDDITAQAHLVSECELHYGDYFNTPHESHCSECLGKEITTCKNSDCTSCKF